MLEKAGGYELLHVRLGPGGIGNLQLIKPPPNGYSVEYLRPVVGSAKIFIMPLQQDSDIDSSTLYGERTTTYCYMYHTHRSRHSLSMR